MGGERLGESHESGFIGNGEEGAGDAAFGHGGVQGWGGAGTSAA